MEFTRWKLIAGGATLAGVVAGGMAAADDGGFDLNDRRDAILLSEPAAASQDQTPVTVDVSPESADSPNESIEESADSPTDSPDDPGYVDPSPESADSPNDSLTDSVESPNDSPGDPGFVDPSPESADSPIDSAQDSPAYVPPAPAGGGGGGGGAGGGSYDSPVSVDSPDGGDS